MIRWFQTRLIIEKPNTHEKYYPSVLRANTQKSSPFSIPYAEIDIASNVIGSTKSYINQLRFDDVLRLQVSIKYNPNQRTIWQDIFQGSVMDLSCNYTDNNNDVTIYAQGHEAEAETALIEETYTHTSQDCKTVLAYYAPKYLTRLTYDSAYADTGKTFPQYDTTANQTYMSDLFADMEKVSGYSWAVKVIPTYSSGNLSTRYIQWKQFPSTATDKYKIIEGTHRVLSAEFEVAGTPVRTAYRVNGDTPSGAAQYTGYASDSTLISRHGKRTAVEVQNWIKSNDSCNSIAAGLLAEGKTPEISGQVVIMGTPEADIGDLVTCKFPSIELNGSSINTNLTVKRVSHVIDGGDYTTTLDLGKVKKTAYDYIGQVSATAKTAKKNQCK
jgi:hypothetical protein